MIKGVFFSKFSFWLSTVCLKFSVTLYVGAILVLTNAAVLRTTEDPNIKEGCLSETELWGSPDGKKFYFCLGNNKSYEDNCPPDTFFVNNATISGCIPFDLVADNCISHSVAPPCNGTSLHQPQPHIDPSKFYYCIAKGVEAQVGNCPNGKAFINENGWLGCLEWTLWRKQRGCEPMKLLIQT